jgi:LuxR family maltose regulon positive regulatory protein
MVSARLACASDDARQTLPLLRAWTGFAERRGCYALAVRFLLLHTRAAYLVGEKSEALRHLLRAVDLGREMGFCRSFVDEYEPISLLLGEIAETASFRGTPQAEYALRLLEAAETTNGQPSVPAAEPAEVLSDEPPAEPLTPREVQILELVEEGLKGNYIASRLAISEGTVRWHLQQIFAKLGVRRRSEAVRRAREFGFMPPSSPGAGRVHLRPGG